MSTSSRRRRRLRRGVYLLPSLFTFGNMLLGFYAFVRASRGEYETAALLIFVAGIVDAFDGRIARLTRTESAFGKEFDSLADVITFGVVPALIAYGWGLERYGRLGWLIPLFYLLCAATRLARFNVQSRKVDSRFFVGLPTPPAASTIGAVLYFAAPYRGTVQADTLMMVTLVATGILMVSTFRYHSFKQLDLTRRWSYRNAVWMAALLLLIAYDPPFVFFSTAIVFTLSGPVSSLAAKLLRWQTPSEAISDEEQVRR